MAREISKKPPIRATLEEIVCHDCQVKVKSDTKKSILKQRVTDISQLPYIEPTIEYHCSIGNDNCRRLKEYLTQQEISRRPNYIISGIRINIQFP